MVFSLALSESRGLGTFFGFSVRVAGWCSPAEVSYFSSFTSPVFFELPGRVDALDDELEDEALDDELAEDELPCPRTERHALPESGFDGGGASDNDSGRSCAQHTQGGAAGDMVG